eukprot:m.63123 g.63123  ORF g.63123 m.63123 type:complete len:378 (+) comp23243_c0_seq1:36-1169(+)
MAAFTQRCCILATLWVMGHCASLDLSTHRLLSALPKGIASSTGVSVSGISSGADLAVQLQVAYSSVFVGAGVFAGQAYHCAVHRFPLDTLDPKANPSVPYCDGCPPNTTLTYDHCKKHPEWTTNVSGLVDYARSAANAGKIDSLETLKQRRVFLYRGKSDQVYLKGSVQSTTNFFLEVGVPKNSVFFETHIDSPHLVPGIDPYLCWWEEWPGKDNCTFDGAGAALKWIYGADAFQGGRDNNTQKLIKKMKPFNQTKYFPTDGRDPLLDNQGSIFIPTSCTAAALEASGADACKLHLFLHGCGVSFSFTVFSQYTGFNEWAERNRLIVLYPKMATRGDTSQEHSGCWDGYGQTGHDYDLKTSSQMETIVNMIADLTTK